jgi:hypothetical protein
MWFAMSAVCCDDVQYVKLSATPPVAKIADSRSLQIAVHQCQLVTRRQEPAVTPLTLSAAHNESHLAVGAAHF